VSQPIDIVQSPSCASAINTAAAEWVQRRRFWDWTDQDQTELDVWLNASSAHRLAFLRMDAGYEGIGRLVALRPGSKSGNSRLHSAFKLARLAAVGIAIATVGGGTWFYLRQTPDLRYETRLGDRETLLLQDGSQIELNTDTALRISRNGDRRKAWLDKGEAYFQIKHDPQHPFVVWGTGYRITDLGTKFVVRDLANRLEVTLIEGRARLDTEEAGSTAHSVLLEPGDVVRQSGRSFSLTRKSPQSLADDLGWRRGVLTFHEETLSEAAEEFNRYNRKKIVIADPRVGKLIIYGTFRSNDVTAFADVAQAYFKLRVENRDDQVALSR